MKSPRLFVLISIVALAGGCTTAPTPGSAPASQANAAGQPSIHREPLDRAPVPIFQARPIYPSALQKAGISGSAVVEFIVASDGSVVGAHAIKATRAEFGAAGVACVSRWRFKPGEKGGRKVNTRMDVPVYFDIRDGTPKLSVGNGPDKR